MLGRRSPYFLAAVLALLGLSCSENIADRDVPNQQPRTFLWLFPDSTVGVGVSRQTLRWFGEDPDGIVVGYLFAYIESPQPVTQLPNPDTLRYTWVTKNDTTLLFPLDTLFRRFVVFVRAVDNTAGGIPDTIADGMRTPIGLTPGPYIDVNRNGVYDAGEPLLPGLMGATDPRGAIETFPIRNTPPVLSFAVDPNTGLTMKQPDTTFTAATFAWKGSDFDGDNTLHSYRIALNDTSDPSRWVTIPIRDTIVSIVVPRAWSDAAPPAPGTEVSALVYGGRFLGRRVIDTIPGLQLDAQNVLYVQVRDVAGEYSPMKAMPSGNDRWFVKRPQARLLLVSDYIKADTLAADSIYRTSLASVPNGQFTTVDRVSFGFGLTAAEKTAARLGRLVPPVYDPALIHTFLLFDYVLWYTDELPSLGVAQSTLFSYLQNGGKVLFTMWPGPGIDTRGALRDFAPVDSFGTVAVDTRVYGSYLVLADSSEPTNLYPTLQFTGAITSFHLMFIRTAYRRSDARYIYRLQESHLNRYPGRPTIGVVDGQRSIIFIGLPLHMMTNTSAGSGLGAFFTKALIQGFTAHRQIDRRRF